MTDPDSRVMKDKMTLIQGYNAQVIASPEQVILAAALTQEPNDSRQLPPMIAQASRAIQSAGISEPIGTVVADGGYWSERAVKLTERKGVSVLVPPFSQVNASKRKTAKPHSETAKRMHALLGEPAPSVPIAGESRSSSRYSPTRRRSDERIASCAAAYRRARPSGSSSPPPTTS